MGKIIYDVRISLDGFIAATGMTVDEGLGVGSRRACRWPHRHREP
jgi:hypothetical protein